MLVSRTPETESKKPGIRLATMHRMKGLEVSCVLLAGVQEGLVPLAVHGHSGAPDRASEED